jgi:hypothetical protein
MGINTSGHRRGSIKGRIKVSAVMALTSVGLVSLVGIQAAGYGGAGATAPTNPRTGFSQPFSGTPQYERLAPTQVKNSDQLNQPIGQHVADELARQMGLTRADAFTNQQYLEFIAGEGTGGDPTAAQVLDESVAIFINTTGHPLYSNVDGQSTPSVLASYGLFVTPDGTLESLANDSAPTRAANQYIAPGPSGYLGQWCKANGATASLVALYKSAYTAEAVFGFASQTISEPDELVTNQLHGVTTTVGMSMVPSIWIVNFLLLYILNPAVAAEMPAKWAPIPSNVAQAITASPTGQVPFSQFASAFPNDGA